MQKTWRRIEFGVAVLGGAAVMGTLGWTLSTAARDWNGDGFLWALLFLGSFVAMLFGFIAPLTLVRYFVGRRIQGSGASNYDAGEISYSLSVGRQWGGAIGYVALVGVYLAFGAVAAPLFDGEFHPFDALVAGDTLAGVSWGAIAGAHWISRRRQKRAGAAEPPQVE